MGGPLFWTGSGPFGTSQEAFVTLTQVKATGREQGLLLKVQSLPHAGPVYSRGAIKVIYDAQHQTVRVDTIRPGSLIWHHYTSIPAVFQNGDQLGARVNALGEVAIYRNGQLVGQVTLTSADQTFFNNKGGRIGLWFIAARDAVVDDFGGGTLVQAVTNDNTQAKVPCTSACVFVPRLVINLKH